MCENSRYTPALVRALASGTRTVSTLTLRFLDLVLQGLFPRPYPGVARHLQRLLVVALALPPFACLQLLHWIGFALDEILFRGYRDIEIRQPTFVLGVPRSGTTFLHRLLAHDPQFTTFSTWECFFAPSISERYVCLACARLDRLCGRPLGRLLGVLERRMFGWLDDVHPVSLAAPEEDYFIFLPLLRCFILVVPFPRARWIWRMGTLDRDASSAERDAVMNWYRRCLQRHLYVHGPGRSLLSKNAAFAGMACSLRRTFPDARLIVCERDALQVVTSQFRAVSEGMKLFGVPLSDPGFRDNLLDCLQFYYRNLERLCAAAPPGQLRRVALPDLSARTAGTLRVLYAQLFDRPLPQPLLRAVDAYERGGRHVPASTAAGLATWDIRPSDVHERFAHWCDAGGCA